MRCVVAAVGLIFSRGEGLSSALASEHGVGKASSNSGVVFRLKAPMRPKTTRRQQGATQEKTHTISAPGIRRRRRRAVAGWRCEYVGNRIKQEKTDPSR